MLQLSAMTKSSLTRVLDYDAPKPPVRQLTLEETVEGFVLTLPVVPAWVHWLGIAMSFTAVGLVAAAFIVQIPTFVKIAASGTTSMLLWSLFILAAPTPLLVATAAYSWWYCRRWGSTSNMLELRENRLRWSYVGVWGMRMREWNISEIRVIRLHRLKSLFGRKVVADLRIKFHKSWPWRRRLSTRDPALFDRLESLLMNIIATR